MRVKPLMEKLADSEAEQAAAEKKLAAVTKLVQQVEAALAKLEAETMLTALIARFPGLTPDPEKPPEWRHRGPFRGLTHLRVRPVA